VSIHDFQELLWSTHCGPGEELERLLYDECVLDPTVLTVGDDGMVIRILDSGLELSFPLTVDEFWSAIHDFDDQVQRRLETRTQTKAPHPRSTPYDAGLDNTAGGPPHAR
jgi:hypothetical protein